MQPRHDPTALPRPPRKRDHAERRLPLDRALHEVRALMAASQRSGPGYGCVDWYFYDERTEKLPPQ